MPSHLQILTGYPIAHRGYFDNAGPFPENSCGAILEAVRLGFAAEMDVMLSADQQVMVFHDDNLQRMCGRSEMFSSLTCAELQTISLRNSREKIPLLSQVLAGVGGRRPLIIELKSFTSSGLQTDGVLEARVVEALQKYDGPVALKSFNPFSVQELIRLRGASHRWPVGFISCDYSKDEDFNFMTPQEMSDFSQIVEGVAPACDFVSYNINDLTPDLSRSIRSKMPIMVWTVRREDQFLKAQLLADNIVFEWRGVKPRPST